MSKTTLRQNNLVLYRSRPGRVCSVDKKVEVEMDGGDIVKVRPKDVTLLHPGPISDLAELIELEGEVGTAWELLAGNKTNLEELAELAYGEFTPSSAWAAWQLVADGLLFSGVPEEIAAHSPELVAQERQNREAKAAERQAWDAFVDRVKSGRYLPEDESYLKDIEALALGTRDQSGVLRALGHTESPQNAHGLLLALGYWDHTTNPYPSREGVATSPPLLSLPELPDEPRRDLTYLQAWAIDDEGNQDPDDALSLEDGRLWVHIADVASLIAADSAPDLEARARGSNLYLPEVMVPMLPSQTTQVLGLGLSAVSPALSFALDFGQDGEISGVEIVPSWIRVSRLSYEEAEARLDEPAFRQMYALAQRYEAHRRQNGAIHIDLPEVKVRVQLDGIVDIQPLPPLRSRDLVREAMLMTGEAVARYALEHDIPVPFTVQDAPDEEMQNGNDPAMINSLAGMFALRRLLRRGQQQSTPAPHAGLGMDLYIQCTSPLRRYLDLVTHQQLRAHLRGGMPLDVQALMERVGAADAVSGSVRRAERLSVTHWTLVYLLQHPGWQGEGVVVDKRSRRALVLIPELGLESQVYPRRDLALNSSVRLILQDVDLSEQEAHFHTID